MVKINSIAIYDGSYFLHRALHLQEVFELKNSKGVRTGGIFQFLRMFTKELRSSGQAFPIVVFDMGLSKRRVDIDPEYKNAKERSIQDNQVLTPEESDIDYVTQYRKQRNILSVFLPYMGVPVIRFAGWEGDDLISILSKLAKQSMIVTDDRDMLQLLSNTCIVRRPKADETWTLNSFLECNGYEEIFDFVLAKSILGDSSDNIPSSCSGVGKGTTNEMVKFVKHYIKDSTNSILTFPRNEVLLKEACEKYEVKYRKAYMNWDLTRFSKNIELIDLSRVPITSQIVKSIFATIRNSETSTDFIKAVKLLSALEIRDVAVDEITREATLKRKYLWCDDEIR